MAKRTKLLPRAAAIKIIEKAGAPRVSDKAGEELVSVLSELGIKISQKAIIFAEHAGRKTVKAEDIKLAYKEL
ncbi:MAG: histone [archaeon]